MKKIILVLMLAFGVGMTDEKGESYYSYFEKGNKAFLAKEYKQAEIHYKKAEDDGGDYAAKGDEAFLAKDYKQAEIYYKQACEKDTNNFICKSIGDKYFDIKDYKQAEIYYKKACERDKIYCAKIDFVKGDKAFSAGDYKQAEIYFKRACENDDKLYAYPICRSITHKYFEIKDYEKAYFYDTFHRQKACEKDSYSYECVGIPRESIDYYLSGTFDRKCKRDFGEEYCSYYKKGAEYLTKKDYKWAKIWFDKACWFGNDDRDSNPPFCLAIGIKYLAIDDYKQAENYFRGVCPASAYCLHEVALQARAEYYLKKQDYEKAAQCFAGACNFSLSNNNDKWAYSSYLTIGYAFFSRKYFKQADIYYKKANDILAKLCKNSDDKKQCAQDLFDDGEEY